MPTTFTNGDDVYTVKTAGTYDLDFLAGNDMLTVNGGASTIARMGNGNDRILLKLGLATAYGDAGVDIFDIWASNAIVDGGADNDTINIRGGANQTAYGGIGADRFNFSADGVGVSLYGGDGDDVFAGSSRQVSGTISGGLGDDYFGGFVTGITLAGGGGNDIYAASVSGPATFLENPGEGVDSVQVARGFNYTLPDNIENMSVVSLAGSTLGSSILTGNALNNRVTGHSNEEQIYGLDGNDNLNGKGGNDYIDGGNGNDYIDGGAGDDGLYGADGNDTLVGRTGNDFMAGGSGDDLYYVDSESDEVAEYSGAGADTVRLVAAPSTTYYFLPANVENCILSSNVLTGLEGNSLDNVLTGNAGDNILAGRDGNDIVRGGDGYDSLFGGDGNDILLGGAGNDTILWGGYGNDDLQGGAGNDVLDGELNNDTLRGDAGQDDLTGGEGADTFVYLLTSDSPLDAGDTIQDFASVSGEGYDDQLDLSAIDANTTLAGDQAFVLNYSGAPSGSAGSLWYTYTINLDYTFNINIYGDVNGDSVADLEMLVVTTTTTFYWNEDVIY